MAREASCFKVVTTIRGPFPTVEVTAQVNLVPDESGFAARSEDGSVRLSSGDLSSAEGPFDPFLTLIRSAQIGPGYSEVFYIDLNEECDVRWMRREITALIKERLIRDAGGDETLEASIEVRVSSTTRKELEEYKAFLSS